MTSSPPLLIRDATLEDLQAIVALLTDDILGRERETGMVDAAYHEALAAIDADPNNRQLVAVRSEEIVGCFQLTFVPGLGRHGSWRAQIESVRIRAADRGGGLGAAMMTWAIAQARDRGCSLVQLTTDKRRDDAQRFYRRLGFTATHEGMKLLLR